MIHVHADPARNINIAAEDNFCLTSMDIGYTIRSDIEIQTL